MADETVITIRANDKFTDVLRKLEVQAKKAGGAVEQIGSKDLNLRRIRTEIDKTSASLGRQQGSFLGSVNNFRLGAVAAFGAASLAIGGALTAIDKFIGRANDLALTNTIFKNLTRDIGDFNKILEDLRTVTHGLVTDDQLKDIANKMFGTGLVTTREELTKLVEIGTKLGQAYGGQGAAGAMENFNAALLNMSYERLDTLGISASTVRDRVRELKEEIDGISTEEAFKIAVVEVGQEALDNLDGAIEDNISNWDRWKISVENTVNDVIGQIEALGGVTLGFLGTPAGQAVGAGLGGIGAAGAAGAFNFLLGRGQQYGQGVPGDPDYQPIPAHILRDAWEGMPAGSGQPPYGSTSYWYWNKWRAQNPGAAEWVDPRTLPTPVGGQSPGASWRGGSYLGATGYAAGRLGQPTNIADVSRGGGVTGLLSTVGSALTGFVATNPVMAFLGAVGGGLILSALLSDQDTVLFEQRMDDINRTLSTGLDLDAIQNDADALQEAMNTQHQYLFDLKLITDNLEVDYGVLGQHEDKIRGVGDEYERAAEKLDEWYQAYLDAFDEGDEPGQPMTRSVFLEMLLEGKDELIAGVNETIAEISAKQAELRIVTRLVSPELLELESLKSEAEEALGAIQGEVVVDLEDVENINTCLLYTSDAADE